MKLLGKCVWHRWKHEKRAGDASIRICKDCGLMQKYEVECWDVVHWRTISYYPTKEEILVKIKGKSISELAEMTYWKKLDKDQLPLLIQIRINNFWKLREGMQLKEHLENRILTEEYNVIPDKDKFSEYTKYYDGVLKALELDKV